MSSREPAPPSRPARPHVPMRPLWRCRACGAHWPCQPARLALLAEYRDDRTALLVYLATVMSEAAGQLAQLGGQPDPAELTARFLTWARAPGAGGHDRPLRRLGPCPGGRRS
ncbi:flavin reductase [Micromonospora sp. PLK6-60]|uniref:flavin reductase n=1 Tax=Micromonospora sp. PLK6-60 TaxID=2873383 RepID=UPI0021073C66|nr:flavin reductase [Micromonospora sp. PLK6-60]